MAGPAARTLVATLLARHGRTYARDAGITVANRPSPLYRLLVLSLLLSARIKADVAVAAARELAAAGYRTATAMRDASWQDRVDALGRGHYRRYDERTATMLGDGATLLLDRYRGDLRRLREQAGGDRGRLRALLTEVPGIGEVGADIFGREVQGVWREYTPYLDGKALDGAGRLGLPTDPDRLASLVEPDDLPKLAAGLVRAALAKPVVEDVRRAALN
jgi:hypothetical protein